MLDGSPRPADESRLRQVPKVLALKWTESGTTTNGFRDVGSKEEKPMLPTEERPGAQPKRSTAGGRSRVCRQFSTEDGQPFKKIGKKS